jgi:hypothetical protein
MFNSTVDGTNVGGIKTQYGSDVDHYTAFLVIVLTHVLESQEQSTDHTILKYSYNYITINISKLTEMYKEVVTATSVPVRLSPPHILQGLESNSGLRNERPASNRLRHDVTTLVLSRKKFVLSQGDW